MRTPKARCDLLASIASKVRLGPGGCWEWTASVSSHGYPQLSVSMKNMRAHRVAYRLFRGPVPEGLTLDHLCRNIRCVNPAHLEPVTMRENTLRGKSLVARNAVKFVCDHGHRLTPENTYMRRNSHRQCRQCARRRTREWRRRRAIAELEGRE